MIGVVFGRGMSVKAGAESVEHGDARRGDGTNQTGASSLHQMSCSTPRGGSESRAPAECNSGKLDFVVEFAFRMKRK